jgi:hypothetical protein
MSEITMIQKELFLKSISKTKKSVMLCTNPNVSKADVARVAQLKANKGSNKGDTTLMFGKAKAIGYSALPNFGTHYHLALDTTAIKADNLPEVGDAFTVNVFVETKEDGTQTPARQVFDKRTNTFVANTYRANLIAQ